MTVLQLPVKESFKTRVSLLPLNGVCFLSWSRALIHSLRARRDLLISAPSNLKIWICLVLSYLVCLFWSTTSAPLSLPARSIKLIFPILLCPLELNFTMSLVFIFDCNLQNGVRTWGISIGTSCTWIFQFCISDNLPVTLLEFPNSIICIRDWTSLIFFSWIPTIFTFCFPSSLACRSCLLFKRSYSFPQ